MLLEIAFQRRFNLVDQLNNKINKNWYSTNINEIT